MELMAKTSRDMPAPYRRKLIAQRQRVETVEARVDAEKEKLRLLVIDTYDHTGVPMQSIADLIGFTKQRCHQWISQARVPSKVA